MRMSQLIIKVSHFLFLRFISSSIPGGKSSNNGDLPAVCTTIYLTADKLVDK